MAQTEYSRFAPANLWYSAREEILFGGGKYSMRLSDEHQAQVVCNRWVQFLLEHSQGMAFTSTRVSTSVFIQLSPLGEIVIRNLGHDPSTLQIVGMNTERKKAFLTAWEEKLKEIS